MQPDQYTLGTLVSEVPSIAEVAEVLAQSSESTTPHLRSLDAPRERFVLVVVAARPNITPEQISELTAMSVGTVKQAIRYLVRDECIYRTRKGGYKSMISTVIA